VLLVQVTRLVPCQVAFSATIKSAIVYGAAFFLRVFVYACVGVRCTDHHCRIAHAWFTVVDTLQQVIVLASVLIERLLCTVPQDILQQEGLLDSID
jgi:hypothetical protein